MQFPKNWFGRNAKETRKVNRPRRVSLELENLEERAVLSTASAAIHAVNDVNNLSAVFYLNKQNGAFYMKDAYYGTRMLSGAGTIQTFSAGTDSMGYADVWVKAGDNSFWEWRYESGWQEVLLPNYVGSFAAVKGDRVYFQNWDHSLWGFTRGVGFNQVDSAGAVQSIDAVTDSHNGDNIFALRDDNTFGQYSPFNWQIHMLRVIGGGDLRPTFTYQQLSGANTVQAGFSAGLDIQGNADVYVIAGDNSFWEHNSYIGWRRLDDANTVSVISATFNEKVDVIATDGTLRKYDQNGTKINQDLNSSFLEISAARDNDVYTTVWDHSGWERTAGGVWNNYAPAGTIV
jgi:hypothetical protein